MRLLIAGLAGAALMAAGNAAALSLLGPKGEFSTMIYDLTWKPKCYAPTAPYRGDKYAMDAYHADVSRWVDCVDDQAKNDAEYAVERVAEGRRKAVEDMKRKVERGY